MEQLALNLFFCRSPTLAPTSAKPSNGRPGRWKPTTSVSGFIKKIYQFRKGVKLCFIKIIFNQII
jgi:hypothetical protein